jgi:transcription-repair coupling factor (superfamily II helicase)
MIPPRKQLSEVAQKRLQAVKEFARLGSGYKIAMRDLTIRGAGDLLGPSQSGFIDTVGIDMYIEMLEEAIAAKKEGREAKPVINETHAANIQKTSYIPKEFAPDDYDKLAMYQKIDEAKDSQELSEYQKIVEDQFGRLPNEVNALFMKKHLDLLLSDPDIQAYHELKNKNEITFSSLFSEKADGVKLFEDFTKISKDAALRYTDKKITVSYPKGKDDLSLAIALIQKAKEDIKHAN